jgi:DNA modification methylase
MEPDFSKIQAKQSKSYKADNIERDEFKVFFTSCEDMSEIPDDTVHLYFTSIPYATMRGTMAYESYTDYLQTMYDIFKEMYRTTKPGRCILINVSDYQISAQLDKEVIKGTEFELGEKFDCPSHVSYLMYKLNQEYAKHYELKYEDTIIWRKSGSTSQRAGTFVQSGNPLKYRPEEVTERILVFRKGNIDYRKIWKEKRSSDTYSDVDMSTFEKFEEWASVDPESMRPYIQNVWDIQPDTQSDHPAPFPPKLPEVAIKLYTIPREIVCDPFLGSATTLERAQALDRKGVGYENLDAQSDETPDFVDMIKNRTGANSATLDMF